MGAKVRGKAQGEESKKEEKKKMKLRWVIFIKEKEGKVGYIDWCE